MSRVHRMIEMTPPSHGESRETLVSVGHRCEYCKGNGWFWGVDEDGEDTKRPCPICKGGRELDAVINVTWIPTCKE